MKKQIFYTQRKNIFCCKDGKDFFRMILEGVFESLSDEEGEALENEGLKPNGVYEIQNTFVGTIQEVQEFLNENEYMIIKMSFCIEDDLCGFLHKSFADVLNDLKCKGIKTIDLCCSQSNYYNFETNE